MHCPTDARLSGECPGDQNVRCTVLLMLDYQVGSMHKLEFFLLLFFLSQTGTKLLQENFHFVFIWRFEKT